MPGRGGRTLGPRLSRRDARGTAPPDAGAAGPERRPRPALDASSIGHTRSRRAQSRLSRRSRGRELVRLRDVTVRYGQSTILEGIDWTVRAGESWALLGPNGSGKTALLSLILGDNPQAYSNEVVVFGRRRGNGESIWEIKRRIGSVVSGVALAFQ